MYKQNLSLTLLQHLLHSKGLIFIRGNVGKNKFNQTHSLHHIEIYLKFLKDIFQIGLICLRIFLSLRASF